MRLSFPSSAINFFLSGSSFPCGTQRHFISVTSASSSSSCVLQRRCNNQDFSCTFSFCFGNCGDHHSVVLGMVSAVLKCHSLRERKREGEDRLLLLPFRHSRVVTLRRAMDCSSRSTSPSPRDCRPIEGYASPWIYFLSLSLCYLRVFPSLISLRVYHHQRSVRLGPTNDKSTTTSRELLVENNSRLAGEGRIQTIVRGSGAGASASVVCGFGYFGVFRYRSGWKEPVRVPLTIYGSVSLWGDGQWALISAKWRFSPCLLPFFTVFISNLHISRQSFFAHLVQVPVGERVEDFGPLTH